MKYYYLSVKEICEIICSSLFKPVEKTIDEMKANLIEKNNEIAGVSSKGFRHLSHFFTTEPIGRQIYALPLLDESLYDKFSNFQNFVDENKRSLLYVSQFIKRVLLTALDSDTNDNVLVDLGNVLPSKLLTITDLKFSEHSYVERDDLKAEWDKYNPEINKLLAMRAIL